MTMTPYVSAASAALLLFVTTTSKSNVGMMMPVVMAQSSNQVLINNDDRFARFRALMDRTGIKANDGKTVFIPTGDALDTFRNENADKWSRYNDKPEFYPHLKEIVLWHFVTEDKFTYEQIFDGSRTTMKIANGNITINQQRQMIENVPGSSFIEKNTETAQGYVHVLDQMILPPFLGFDLIQQLLDYKNDQFAYSTMANLALYAKLDDRLNAVYENGLTFLVPPNIRFNRAEIDISKLLTPEIFNFTRDMVLCHMIPRNLHERGIYGYHAQIGEDQHLVTSELGTHMWVTTTEKKLRFQSIDVLIADRPAENRYVRVCQKQKR